MAKFAKGQSGNPGGRPKALGDLRELSRAHTGAAVEVLVCVMNDADAAPSARVGAASALLDRGWGRPVQSIDASINANNGDPDCGLAEDASALLKLFKQRSENKRITETAPHAESEAEATPALDVTAH
jgi:hypothetical protein